jgi:outer membrane protein TolC
MSTLPRLEAAQAVARYRPLPSPLAALVALLALPLVASAQEQGSGLAQAPAASRVLGFQQVLEKAEAQNLDLQVARAKLAQAREISAKVRSGYLPRLTAGASYTYNGVEAILPVVTGYYIRDVGQPQGPSFNPSLPPSPENPPGAPTSLTLFPSGITEIPIQVHNQLGAQVQLDQALIAPSLIAAIGAASLAEETAELGTEAARREILFAAAQLYFGAAGLKEAVAVQQRLLEVNTARERDAKARYDVGAQPKVALLRAQIDKARIEQDLLRARNAYHSALSALATLLDEPADFDVEVPEEPVLPEVLKAEELESEALRSRPDVKAALKSVERVEASRSSVAWKYAPSVGLSAFYRVTNVAGFAGRPDVWAATVALQWTLFDGGLREAELRESGAQVAEAQASARAAENKARDEVRRALLDLESAQANRRKAAEQLTLARENVRLVEAAVRVGTATYLEQADANAALLGAETGYVGETINASLAALRLLKAAGRFGAAR